MIIGEETKEIIKETEQLSFGINIMLFYNVMKKKDRVINPDAIVYSAGCIWRAHDPPSILTQMNYITSLDEIKKVKEVRKKYNNAKYTGDFFLNHNSQNNLNDTYSPAECFSIAEFCSRKMIMPEMSKLHGYMAKNIEDIMDIMSGCYEKMKNKQEPTIPDNRIIDTQTTKEIRHAMKELNMDTGFEKKALLQTEYNQ